jgi:hypothetical protein
MYKARFTTRLIQYMIKVIFLLEHEPQTQTRIRICCFE